MHRVYDELESVTETKVGTHCWVGITVMLTSVLLCVCVFICEQIIPNIQANFSFDGNNIRLAEEEMI